MYATLLSATLLSALSALSVRADDFVVPTIALTQCASTNITFSGGVAPFDVAIVPVSDPCDTVLEDFGSDINTWDFATGAINITAGTQVMISIIDANNEEAWSGAITIGDGDDSCLTGSSSSASASASESASVGSDDATTLLLTSTYESEAVAAATKSSSASSESATIVGAANAGELGSSSGAVPALSHMSTAGATVVASLLALSAAFVL